MSKYWRITVVQLALLLLVGAIISGCSSRSSIGAQIVPELEAVCGDIRTRAQVDALSGDERAELMMRIGRAQEAFAQKHGLTDEQRKQARKDRDRAIRKSKYREVLGYYLLPAK